VHSVVLPTATEVNKLIRLRNQQMLCLSLLLPEQQHKATDKRSEIVLAINFGRRTKRNGSEHLME